MYLKKNFAYLVFLTALLFVSVTAQSAELLNVSYDATRELYTSYNKLFNQYWLKKTGQEIRINQSHGGSGAQARAVVDGLEADVVTLALAYDIDIIAEKAKLLPLDWQKKFPHSSCPYTSTIVFLVRKNNPKNIHDWSDLIRPDIKVITPNPKTSGGARWNYLAAWGYALKKNNDNEAEAKKFMAAFFKNVPVLDTGARGAIVTFTQRGIGDVLLAWENEALLATHSVAKDKFEIVLPSISILAEPPIAVVEKNTEKNGTSQVAKAYLENLYSPEAQDLIAKHYYRPVDTTVAARYKNQFPTLKLLTIKDFGGWQKVQEKHFNDGGIFDQIMHHMHQ